MMKAKSLVVFLCLIMMLAITMNCDESKAKDESYIQEIRVVPFKWIVRSWPPAIGCAPLQYHAETVMSDGKTATDDKYKDMLWIVERYNNVSKTFTTIETGTGENIDLWVPYGTTPGDYRITAVSKVDQDASGYAWKHLDYYSMLPNFCICKRGNIKYGEITGDEPGPGAIKEKYDKKTDTYTSVLPVCPYKSKDYSFAGWKVVTAGKEYSGKIYKERSVFVAKNIGNVDFEAQWKPNFKMPTALASREKKKRIKLRWNRMIGSKGYKLYRSANQKGKYRLIKTISSRWKTSWIDKKVKPGKDYYYKVAAYNKKQKKSAWVRVSTKAANVFEVKLSKKDISGTKGDNTKVKAKIITGKGKILDKNVRWYSSNKKIAIIDRKTGKVRFVNEGKCRIWAKAYNGKNSKKINVTVTVNVNDSR